MANTIIIQKLENNNVEIIDVNNPTETLLSTYGLRQYTDFVSLLEKAKGRQEHSFKVVDVEKVIRKDGTEVLISDVDTLYSELKEYFFFEPSANGGINDEKIQVDTRNDLPITIGDPAIGEIYLVKFPVSETFLGLPYKTYQSGLYIRDFDNGDINDWRRLNVKVEFTDNEFKIVNNSDKSKQFKLSASLITSGVQRLFNLPDKNGTVALLDDIPLVSDDLVKVSNDDSTPDYLEQKLISTNSSISLSVNTPAGNEKVDLNLVEPLNDGGIYLRNGLTQQWVRVNGSIGSFKLSSKEQNQNINDNQFFGVLVESGKEGTYNSFSTIYTQNSLGAGQTKTLRYALYALNGDIITQGSVLIDQNSPDVQIGSLNTVYHAQSVSAYYLVCGHNDTVGGGAIQIARINSNQTNNPELAFTFTQATGVLPAVLPVVSQTNNVLYQNYYGV